MPGKAAVRIRPFSPSDADALVACVVELQDSERRIDPRLRPGSEMVRPYCEALLARSARFSGAIFMAEMSGEIVGFVAVQARVPFEDVDEPPGTHALVSDLVVLPPHRRRGIARALLKAAEDHARAQGARDLRIGVLARNAGARALYQAFGFQPHFELFAKTL